MSNVEKEAELPPSEVEQAATAGLVPQVSMMVRALVASSVFRQLLMLGFSIFIVVAATAWEQIQLNSWSQPFYNALSSKNFYGFLNQLLVFAEIAAVLLALNVAQRWLVEMTKLKLRQGLVQDLIGTWLANGRAFKLANAGPIGVNPDQRMHEDARHLTELSTDLGTGLLQATLLLFSFISVLWTLSSDFAFHLGWLKLAVPGYMVWAAFLYAGSASFLTYFNGRRLIAQNAARYAREAEFRFSLMRVNENIDSIALSGGEQLEATRLNLDLQSVLAAMRKLVSSLTRLTWVTSGYGWFTIIAPILVATPVYFSGSLSFGGLMMAAGAFNQVQNSLRWYVDNFSSIADWRATLLRVASFRAAAMASDALHRNESRIAFETGEPGELTLDHLQIASPNGCHRFKENSLVVRSGERVAVVPDPGANDELLFRAIAGLWPWGSGRIALPPDVRITHIPHRPYIPQGSLRDILTYPSAEYGDDQVLDLALTRVGLDRLKPLLGDGRRWDRELSDSDVLAIAIARALLHNSEWLVIDGALDSMDEATLERIAGIFENDFKSAGILYIGRAVTAEKLKARTTRLLSDTSTRHLRRGELHDVNDADPASLLERA